MDAKPIKHCNTVSLAKAMEPNASELHMEGVIELLHSSWAYLKNGFTRFYIDY